MNAMTGTLATRPVSMDDAPMDDVQRWPAFRRAARTTTGDKAAVKKARASLRSRFPDLAVLVLTMHDDDESVFAALRAGARGYLLKGADAPVLLATVRALARGETVFGDAVARRIVDFFVAGSDSYGARVFPELTGREREVLDLLAAGLRNGEIARRLGMSEKTLRNHISAVFAKLAVPDRSAAIVRAREAGLGRAAPERGGSA